MNPQPLTVFTIGHSTHPIEVFIQLLREHQIEALVDVRSSPFSRFNPQFNKPNLERSLREQGIKYVFLGLELGARSDDPSCYERGRVIYERLASTKLFRSGLERVLCGAEDYRVALMCAEKDPLECHRTLLVARTLDDRDVNIVHILADGRIEAHEAAMTRLLEIVGLPQEDLFRSRAELVGEALAMQEKRIAYVDEKLVAKSAGGAV